MDLNSLIIIDKIAKRGSFTAAARALRMPNSNLSLKVKQLEEELGQPLFTRTTRKVVITDFGRKVLALAEPALRMEDEIRLLSEEARAEPSGRIRVAAPYDLGLHLLKDVIPPFIAAHPKVHVEIEMSNHYVDIVEGGFDFAIRASRNPLEDSSTIAVKLGETALHLYAHKKSTFASISKVTQLEGMPILSFGGGSIRLTDGSQHRTITSSSRIIVKDMAGIRQVTLGKAGIGVLPDITCSDEQSRLLLTRICPNWEAGRAAFYALFPNRMSLTPKNHAFLEFLKTRF